jgi:hypothetical protein
MNQKTQVLYMGVWRKRRSQRDSSDLDFLARNRSITELEQLRRIAADSNFRKMATTV